MALQSRYLSGKRLFVRPVRRPESYATLQVRCFCCTFDGHFVVQLGTSSPAEGRDKETGRLNALSVDTLRGLGKLHAEATEGTWIAVAVRGSRSPSDLREHLEPEQGPLEESLLLLKVTRGLLVSLRPCVTLVCTGNGADGANGAGPH